MGEKRQAQLAKNTAILTFGKICTQCVSFFLLPLYTALLDPSDYGIVDLISTYAALLLPIVNLMIDMGLFRFMLDVREEPEKQKKMVSSVLNLNHLQTGIFLTLFLIIQFFVGSEYKLFLALEVVLSIYTATLMQISRGIGRNDIYSISSFLSASLAVVFNVLFIAVFRMGVLGMFLGLIVSKILTVFYLLWAIRIGTLYDIKCIDKELLKEICTYSTPLVPNQLAWWVVGASDRIVVSNMLSVAHNGIYSVANKFSSMYIIFYNIFNLAWTESCALHINDDDCDEYLSSVITSMFSLFSAVCIGIVACMPFVFPILINPNYHEAYYQIPILLLAVLCQSIIGLVSVVYTAKKLSSVLAKTSVWIAIINLGTDLLLIKYIGLYAASLSTLIAFFLMMVYRYIDVQKYTRIVIPKKKIIIVLLVATVVGGAYYSNSLLPQLFALGIAIIYAFVENRMFLLGGLVTIKNKLKTK